VDDKLATQQKSKRRSKRIKPTFSKSAYPHISFEKKISNGKPIISGTRTSVRIVAGYYQMGMSVDEILATLSHLTPSQVHSALAYYFDNQKEIDSDIHDNESYYDSNIVL